MQDRDAKLIAYLDGELSAKERAELETALEENPALADRLHELRAADQWFTDRFKGASGDTIRADTRDLAAQLADKLTKPDTATGDNVVAFPPKAETQRQFQSWTQPAIAASIALFVGLGAGLMLGPSDTSGPSPNYQSAGLIQPGSPLYQTLETRASLEPAPVGGADDITATALTTFRSHEGIYCREYLVSSPQSASRGLACRGQEGWHVKATVAAAPSAAQLGQEYIPASQAEAAVLDEVIMTMIDGDMLGRTAEKALIEHHWQQ